jgi:hypothetical protein
MSARLHLCLRRLRSSWRRRCFRDSSACRWRRTAREFCRLGIVRSGHRRRRTLRNGILRSCRCRSVDRRQRRASGTWRPCRRSTQGRQRRPCSRRRDSGWNNRGNRRPGRSRLRRRRPELGIVQGPGLPINRNQHLLPFQSSHKVTRDSLSIPVTHAHVLSFEQRLYPILHIAKEYVRKVVERIPPFQERKDLQFVVQNVI